LYPEQDQEGIGQQLLLKLAAGVIGARMEKMTHSLERSTTLIALTNAFPWLRPKSRA